MKDGIEYVNPYSLKPDPNNPRTEMDKEFIEKLAENYKQHGIIEPIEIDENNVIRRGHQRVEAAKLAGIDRVPVRRVVGLSEEKWFERQLADDALRKQLSTIDRAFAYATAIININTGKNYKLKDIKKMWGKDREQILNLVFTPKGRGHDETGQAELSRRIGVPQEDIRYYLNVLKYDMVEAVETGKTTPATIREISPIKDEEVKEILLERAREGKIDRRDLIREIRPIVQREDIPKEVKVAVAKGEVKPEHVDMAVALHKAGEPITFAVTEPSPEELLKLQKKDIEDKEEHLEYTKDFGI